MVKIGLEIHGYLLTNEKLFCRCKSEHGLKNSKPNMNICPTCTGQPGSKPLLPNKIAVDKIIQIALILGCKINNKLVFQRKHYDWADLPKGFQTTISGPHAIPVGEKGNFSGIKIREAHLEEDPAAWNPQTGEIDYNRSGSPLIEIVTEPDFENSEQVIEWLKKLIAVLGYVKSIDKKAGLKADVNVSIPKGERVEIKNINSLKNIKTAIEYEIERQKKDLPINQETRMFNEKKGVTIKMRSKEQTADYRFISEPDSPAILIDKKRIEKIEKELPETPDEKLKKIIKKYKIDKKSAEVLTKKLDIVEFFENIVEKVNPKIAVPWTTIELLRILNYAKKELDEVDINPEHFIELLKLIESRTITELKAKEILNKFIPKSFSVKEVTPKSLPLNLKINKPKIIIEEIGIISKSETEKICKQIIKENSKAVEDYKEGKQEALNFLVGQVMKLSNKRADYKTAREILVKELG